MERMITIEKEEHKSLRENVRDFVKKRVEPICIRMDEEDMFPVDLFKEMGKMGYLGVTIPEEYGGSGMDYLSQGIIEEELGYSSASLALSYGAHSNLCLDSLFRNGSKQHREEYVPKLSSGQWIGSLGLTEPSSGSDALAMKTTAERNGDIYTINGSKTLITNAPYSDFFLTYAKTGGNYTAFAILSTDEGFSRGKKFNKMGMRGSPTGEIYFQNLQIREDRIVGKLGGAKSIILSGLNIERIILSFIFVGIARRALEESLKYSIERKQFGQPLYEFEMIQDKLATMYTKYETARIMAYESLVRVQEDKMDALHAASAILYAAEISEQVSRDAIQIHGGYGYVKDSGIERLLRDAILGQIGAGTTEIRKHIIAGTLIKQFKDNPRILE